MSRSPSPFHLAAWVHLAALAATLLALVSAAAHAEQSVAHGPVFESDEVALTLVAEEPDAEGTIRAALLFDLRPGWKTYWVDPGEAGIPTRIDLSQSRNIAAASTMAFPAPHRFGDAYGMSNGYSAPMAVALTLRETLPGETTAITAKVTLGVCQAVCIPVSATVSLPLGDSSDADEALVAQAFGALPEPSTPGHGITRAELSTDAKTLRVSAELRQSAGEARPDLFVAGPKGWSFGAPTTVEAQAGSRGGTTFTVPVLEKPRRPGTEPLTIDAVVTNGDDAVEVHSLAVLIPEG